MMSPKRSKRSISTGKSPSNTPALPKKLLGDLRLLIDHSREQVARTVNSELVWLYWNIGMRIREDVLKRKRADYGEQIVVSLSKQLTEEYGRGFSRQSLFRMVRFAEVFPEEQIVSSLMRQLSWTHLIYIIALDEPLKREFYAEMCRLERWSVRTCVRRSTVSCSNERQSARSPMS